MRFLATSSIMHNFVITDTESAVRFINALDEAEQDRTERQPSIGKLLTDGKEIMNLMENWKKHHVRKVFSR